MFWLSGLLLGIFLMLGDELINFADCCRNEKYPFPLIGSYSVWQSWEIAFSGILIAALIGVLASAVNKNPRSDSSHTVSNIG